MTNLSKQQQRQEDQYAFPYHYLPRIDDRSYSQVVAWNKGYEYLSYVTYLLSYLEKIEFHSLLDVGCGDGRFICEALKRFPNKELLGTDYSERAIQIARTMCPQGRYILGDLTSDNIFVKQYDVIVSIETLEHIPLEQIDDFMRGIAGYLSENGYFLLTTPSTNTPVQPKHYQHFSQDSLEKTLAPYFEIQELRYLNRNSVIVNLTRRLISNRVFILREPNIMRLVYQTYLKYFLIADAENGIRLFAVCRKQRE